MKFTIVVLVLGALLLQHHDASVDAFRQTSHGHLNRHLKKLTWTWSKSVPMHGYLDSLGNTLSKSMPRLGYLDSLGNTASTFKVKLVNNLELDKIMPLPEERSKSAETKAAINGAFKDFMLKSEAIENVKAPEIKVETSMPQWEMALKNQEATPGANGAENFSAENEIAQALSAVKGMVKAAEGFTNAAPDMNLPEINAHKVGTADRMSESASAPSGGYLGSLTEMSSEDVELAATEMAGAPTTPIIARPEPLPSEKPKPNASTKFGGYLGMLSNASSQNVVPDALKMPESPVAVDALKLQTDGRDVPAAAEMAGSPTSTTSDTREPVSSAKPKPRSASTNFGGYLGSLTKALFEDGTPATSNMPEEQATVDTHKLQTDGHDVPTTTEMKVVPTATSLDTPEPVSSAKPKPRSASSSFGGYIGSLMKGSSEVLVPATASMPESLTTADAPKLQTDDHDVPTAAETLQAPTTPTVDTVSSASMPKSPFAVDTFKLKTDYHAVPATAEMVDEPTTPTVDKASSANMPKSPFAVDTFKLRTDYHAAPAAAEMIEAPITPTVDTPKPVSSANMPESPVAADAPKFQADDHAFPAAAERVKAPTIATVDTVSSEKMPESPVAVDAPMFQADDHAFPAAAERVKAPTTPTVDTPEPFWMAKPTPKSSPPTKASSEVVVPPTDEIPESPTAIDIIKMRTDDHAVPAAARMMEFFTTTKEFAETKTAVKTDTSIALEMAAWPLEEAAPMEMAATVKEIEAGTAKIDWETASPIILQGGALRTWSDSTGTFERVQLSLNTEGRPLNAHVELWHGPDNTPLRMSIYSDNGDLRPFNAVIETPAGQNTVAIRNTGTMEFPLAACVGTDVEDVAKRLSDMGTLKVVQGGSIVTYPFDRSVASVQILLMTNGRPLNARIEISQGPNSSKQYVDIYTENGMERPFFAVIETPGAGSVIRVVNTGTVEFPVTACLEPYEYMEEPGSIESSGGGWDNGDTSSFQIGGR
jgi:hypothetical protein